MNTSGQGLSQSTRPNSRKASRPSLFGAALALSATVMATVVTAFTATPAFAQAAPQGSAQGYPDRAVNLIVPYPAGGGADAIARRLGQALARHWSQPVVVENVPGAEASIGSQRVLRANPDGHTVLLQLNQMLLWKATMPDLPIDVLRDFIPVSKIQRLPMVFGVNADFPGKTMKDFATWCAAAPKPCSWGSATAYGRLVGHQLMSLAGVSNSVNVPYKGTAPMMIDVRGGHIVMALPSVGTSLQQVRAGQFKALAVGSRQRVEVLADVPTLAEQGIDMQGESWYALFVAKGTPAAVLAALSKAVQAVSTDRDLLASIETNGGTPVFNSPQDFAKELVEEIRTLGPLVERYGAEK